MKVITFQLPTVYKNVKVIKLLISMSLMLHSIGTDDIIKLRTLNIGNHQLRLLLIIF